MVPNPSRVRMSVFRDKLGDGERAHAPLARPHTASRETLDLVRSRAT